MQLCYIDTDSFLIHTKIRFLYKNIKRDVEEKLDTSNYEGGERPLPIRTIKNIKKYNERSIK